MRIENGLRDINIYQQSQQQSKTEPVQENVDVTTLKNQRIQEVAETKTLDEKQSNEHEVIKAIEKANKHIRMYDRKLEFSIHDLTKQIMVRVIDTDSDKVIREIPSEKILDMVGHLWEVAGILVDEKR